MRQRALSRPILCAPCSHLPLVANRVLRPGHRTGTCGPVHGGLLEYGNMRERARFRYGCKIACHCLYGSTAYAAMPPPAAPPNPSVPPPPPHLPEEVIRGDLAHEWHVKVGVGVYAPRHDVLPSGIQHTGAGRGLLVGRKMAQVTLTASG